MRHETKQESQKRQKYISGRLKKQNKNKKKSRLPEGEQVTQDQVAFMKLTRLKTDSRMKGWKETCCIAGRILFKIRLIKLWLEDHKTCTVL